MADGLGITPAQLALAWVQAKGEDIVPIPGTKSPRRLEENAAAVDVRLSAADIAALDAALPADGVAGTRYSASDMELLSH
jgi:aryl-alcohol dehydrogenase-like predicted oxidoreductase